MNEFSGFPARMLFTPIPNLFFSAVLPQISDINELKVTLHIFELIYSKKGYPKYVSITELLAHPSLMKDLRANGKPPEEILKIALDAAVKRGTILSLTLKDGAPAEVYFLNDDAGRRAVSRIQSGALVISGLEAMRPVELPAEEPTDIFTLYEQNIGLITPILAEQLKDAEKNYPREWIRDAIKEAVLLKKQNWRYIARILERWASEGRRDGAYRGDIKKADPDKYVKGKYGHVVRR